MELKPFTDEQTRRLGLGILGGFATFLLDLAYEVGYEFFGLPDLPTIGKGSGGFRLPNLDDILIDLGTPAGLALVASLTGDKDLLDAAIGSASYGIPMFGFNTWRMTAAEIKAGPGVLKKVETEGVERSTESHRIIKL